MDWHRAYADAVGGFVVVWATLHGSVEFAVIGAGILGLTSTAGLVAQRISVPQPPTQGTPS